MARCIVTLLSCIAGLTPLQGQEPVIWVASPWQHVLREAAPGAARTASIVAARNEYEPVRIIVRAGAEPLRDVRVVVSDLRGPAGTIAADQLAVFREHYVHIFQPSHASPAPAGWYPDALIPLRESESPARFPGVAPEIAPETNQGFWVDVYVPRTTPPGAYSGSILVDAGTGSLGSVPLELQVEPFTLPDTIAMRSHFGELGARLARQLQMEVDSPEFAAVEDRYIDLLLAHRAIPSSLGSIWPAWTREGGIDDRHSGSRLRAMVEDRHVNALCVPFLYRADPERCQAYLRDMAAYLRDKGWLDLAYIYLEDEPNNAAEYETVRQQGALIRDSGIKRLCTEQTVTSDPAWGTLYGAVDIWCPLWCLFDEPSARARQELGEDLWSYTALCQGRGKTPFWEIDYPPVHFRAPFWISWNLGLKGVLYWSSIFRAAGQDPWTAPYLKTRYHREPYWGEGLLVYPGQDAGQRAPVPSIRLKLIREGLEDFEYMTLATQQGRRAEVDAIVGRVTRSFTDWSDDDQDYRSARAQLAALIQPEVVDPAGVPPASGE